MTASIAARLLMVLLLASCTPDVQPGPVPPPGQTTQCGAAELQDLVGQPATVLETMRFAPPTRIIRPGQPVTADYREDRLNIEIDGAGRISRVYCT